jgi:hypothetical protein
VARSPIDIVALDLQLGEQLAKHSSLNDFKVVLWRQEPDDAGCNWNARIERVRPSRLNDISWWDVVPQMRQRFNLT